MKQKTAVKLEANKPANNNLFKPGAGKLTKIRLTVVQLKLIVMLATGQLMEIIETNSS